MPVEEDDDFVIISSMLSSPHDLDIPLTEDDVDLMEEFEARWSDFMRTHPDLIPYGRRSKRIRELRSQVLEARMSKSSVEKEMKAQLKVFTKARDTLELNYKHEMQDVQGKKQAVHDHLQTQLDNIAVADRLESQLASWEHFCELVDKASVPITPSKNKDFKPSVRAMALVDPSGETSDVQLRAYRVDHALLTTQVEMLQKEIERYEKSREGLEIVGEFLTENNIYSLLSKSLH